MFVLKDIIKKLKLILKSELRLKRVTNKDVAKALNINYNTFKQHIHKNKIAFKEIMLFCAKRKISINWLFFEQLPEILIKPTQDIVVLKYSDVYASLGNGIENYVLEPLNIAVDKILLDSLNANYKYTELIKSSGDSMEPLIPDNSFIFIDCSQKDILNNKIYCFITNDELFIKKIIIQNNSYIARSLNTQYEDIKLNNFKIIGKVAGILNKIS